jgi:hypothetical protein
MMFRVKAKCQVNVATATLRRRPLELYLNGQQRLRACRIGAVKNHRVGMNGLAELVGRERFGPISLRVAP